MSSPGRLVCALSIALVAIVVRSADAQPGAAPSANRVMSPTSATIPPAFAATPGVVTADDACPSGACFDVSVAVRANTKWQLQATLTSALPNFNVAWVESRSPFVSHQMATGVYQTVAAGNGALNQNVALLFNANSTTGKGDVPTAAQLAAVLSYRVIAAP